MKHYLLFMVGLIFSLATAHVHCGDESVAYVVKRLGEKDTCYNATKIHPSRFDECPLPPFPVYNTSYATAIREVPALAIAHDKLYEECYQIVLKTICIMSVEICTDDGYVVGMFDYEICLRNTQCAIESFGVPFLEKMCRFVVDAYTDTRYNGTDQPTYYVAGIPNESIGRAGSLHCNYTLLQLMMIATILQSVVKRIM